MMPRPKKSRIGWPDLRQASSRPVATSPYVAKAHMAARSTVAVRRNCRSTYCKSRYTQEGQLYEIPFVCRESSAGAPEFEDVFSLRHRQAPALRSVLSADFADCRVNRHVPR